MAWFEKKTYPEFWKRYAQHFKGPKKRFEQLRFVVFDTETTGLDPGEDALLSVGAIGITQGQLIISDTFECYVAAEVFKKEAVPIHGIRKSTDNKLPEKAAIEAFVNFIKDAVLVGHHIAFDIAMVNAALHKMGLPKLKNASVDTGNLYVRSAYNEHDKTHVSLDEVAKTLSIPLHDRHTASGDAYITALVFVKLLANLKKRNTLSLPFLQRPAKRRGLL